jgi:hypothetical protein
MFSIILPTDVKCFPCRRRVVARSGIKSHQSGSAEGNNPLLEREVFSFHPFFFATFGANMDFASAMTQRDREQESLGKRTNKEKWIKH